MATRVTDNRPDPETLLAEASREGRGKLKIFLGAAPGVGKTFEMLTQGRRRRLEGVDVVIAVVETHGRVETEALTKGFEVVPKKRSLYKGHVVAEMDLDAVLQRRPRLALVDELAHTNAEGSRHPKRYQDVEELLAAGIDVYTTINIQHIDSLNDVVAQITRIRVRETVPDYVLDQANEIELVDTTSDDLLERLKDGKVYIKAQAERALKHFFQPGNLAALRELALRKAAQHVDRDMVDYMQAHAIGGPWAAGEHVLCCINEQASSAELVRRGRRLADNLKAPLTVLYVEGPRHLGLSEAQKGSRRRHAADCRAFGGRDRDAAGARYRGHGAGLCPAQKHHPHPDRKIRTVTLVRIVAWFGGARADAQFRCDFGDGGPGKRRRTCSQNRRDGAAAARGELAGIYPQQSGHCRHGARGHGGCAPSPTRPWAASACCFWCR